MSVLFSCTDGDGDTVNVVACGAFAQVQVMPASSGARSALVPGHKVPEICRALFAAAGLPVPDLPDIPDPALVEALAKDIYYAQHGTNGPDDVTRDYARTLLSLGWRKDVTS